MLYESSEHDTLLSLSTNVEECDQFPFDVEEEQTPVGGETELVANHSRVIRLNEARLVVPNLTPLPYSDMVTGRSPTCTWTSSISSQQQSFTSTKTTPPHM